MRHLIFVVLTSAGVGCSMLSGHAGGPTVASLGDSPAASSAPSSGSPADAFTAGTTMPNQVKRIVYARDKVAEQIDELEKGAANGQLDDEHFHHARVYFTIEYYESLIAGGVPAC
ncbi:MAG TPA: hypothetical protein VFK02_34680, partial [Kofleriaceae bacterium]|nr:hypothetical protein [Kofleriaceae bacterium]